MRGLAVLLLAFSVQCTAAPFAVQVGEARIALDTPPGFTDTTYTGSPRLQELGESLTSASNRVLLFALTDADLRRFTLGDQLELRRYLAVFTERRAEQERSTESSLKAMAGDLERELAQAPAGDYQKHIEAQPPGAVSMLAALRREPDVISVLQGTRAKGRGFFEKSTYFLSSTSVLLVRGKALQLSVYTQYDQPADLEWIRAVTVRWIDELKRINNR